MENFFLAGENAGLIPQNCYGNLMCISLAGGVVLLSIGIALAVLITLDFPFHLDLITLMLHQQLLTGQSLSRKLPCAFTRQTYPNGQESADGSIWLFTMEKVEGFHPFTIQANYEGFAKGIAVGDELVVDGGMATFEVVEKVGKDLRCKCTDPGLLFPWAKLTFWRDGQIVSKNFELPILLTKDWADIDFGISEGVDYIIVSYVKEASDINLLKEHLSSKSADCIGVLAKLESLESLQNLEDIVKASNGIMFERGDLGVEVPLKLISSVQDKVTRICQELNKPIIVASQLLELMVEYPTPTLAEVADVSEKV